MTCWRVISMSQTAIRALKAGSPLKPIAPAAIGAKLTPHAQGQCRSGRPAAGGRLGRATFGDRYRAARTRHGHDLFARIASKKALRTARISAEWAQRNQTRLTGWTGRTRWTGRPRWPGFADRSRRAFFALGSGRSRGASRARRSLRPLKAARECKCRQHCNDCDGSAHRYPIPRDLDFKRSISFQLSQSNELDANVLASSAVSPGGRKDFQKSKDIQSNGQLDRQTLSDLHVKMASNQNMRNQSNMNQSGTNNPAPDQH